MADNHLALHQPSVLEQGKFEDISIEANKIFLLDTFEGVRIDWQRPLSNAFGVNHLLHLQVESG